MTGDWLGEPRSLRAAERILDAAAALFAERHPEAAVLGYIKTIAINVTLDCFKSLHSKKRGAGETDRIVRIATTTHQQR